MKKVFCNQCGRQILSVNDRLEEDIFEGKKQWGYFSKRDLELHSFILCEDCYDRMIEGFKLPVEISPVHEAM